jgi:hypothetical protein
VAALVVPTYRQPPGIYRAARALRWVGGIVLVLLIVYAATVAVSAYEAAHATVESRNLSNVLVANGDLDISGSFTLSNPGWYAIEGVQLTARLANTSGVYLGTATAGPQTVDGGSSALFPISIALPIAGSTAAESLLFVDQYIDVNAWANVTYAYLFPLSVTLAESRSWGAPFEGFHATVGTPSMVGGSLVAPVTLLWTNHASFVEQGSISFIVDSAGGATCGGGSDPMDVAPDSAYDETEPVTLNPGCSPLGGELLASVTIDGSSTPLPPEPIP